MSGQIEISVIVTVYNLEKYMLREYSMSTGSEF